MGDELISLYSDPGELLKHARVVDLEEVEENEFNLNVPRYVETFETEKTIHVNRCSSRHSERSAGTKLQETLSTKLTRLLRCSVYSQDLKC